MVAHRVVGMETHTLDIRHLTVRYGSRVVLNDISWTVTPGIWTHIVGPNGAGKSTLLKAILGLEAAGESHVWLDGRSLAEYGLRARAALLAYVPQQLESVPHMRVDDFVRQGAFGRKEAAAGDEIGEIAHLRDAYLDEISGGERQLCVLASAFYQSARFVLLDEPTNALDIHYIYRLSAAVRAMVRRGVTVISVSHDLSFVSQNADETLLLSGGCLVKTGSFPSCAQLSGAFGLPESCFERYVNAAHNASICPVMPLSADVRSRVCKRLPKRWVCASVCVAVIAAAPLVGASVAMPWGDDVQRDIFFNLRLPRVLWGAIAGSGLAVVGASFQSLFQNPLASPYTLGVASGASLGAVAAIAFGFYSLIALPAWAAAGGLGVLGIILLCAGRSGMRSPVFCLLFGVAAAMFASALSMIVQAMATPMTALQMMRWQLGGLEFSGYETLAAFPVIALGLGVLFKLAPALELLSVDAPLAQTRGVNVARVQCATVVAASLVTSIIVAFCGPISFIGLIIPNILRMKYGAPLSQTMAFCAMLGAVVLVFADTLSRLLERFASVPVGVIAAIIGAPVFVAILLRARRSHP